jgi:regulator of sirC expression with transglutaminase-like and TPR domain
MTKRLPKSPKVERMDFPQALAPSILPFLAGDSLPGNLSHAYFAQLMADSGSLPLTEAACAIAQDAYPELDTLDALTQIDAFAATLARRMPKDAGVETKLRYLNRYFFHELGFCGNRNDYYNADNSFIHRVLQTRRGIPITLAVIYIDIAQQIGLRAQGVGFPGHFLVKIKLPAGEVIMDPFTGASLSRESLEEWLSEHAQVGGSPLPLQYYLKTAPAREILARMLRNLKQLYRQSANWSALLSVTQRLVLALPDDTTELRDRGLANERLGNVDEAIADLQTYLDRDPDARDNALMEAKLRSLRAA